MIPVTAGTITKFAEVMKINGAVDSEEDAFSLQADIVRRAKQWQVAFNLEKCEVVHFGRPRALKCSSPGKLLLNIICSLSSAIIPFLSCDNQNCTQYSCGHLTNVL